LAKNLPKLKYMQEQILALEIAMSKPRFDRVERRDRRKSYNHDPPIYKIDAFYRVEYILY
jgi:hypothetical protein